MKHDHSETDPRCAEVRERLSALLDGELQGQGAVRAHVATCAPCAEHLDALRALSRGLRDGLAAEPPPALRARIARMAPVAPVAPLERAASSGPKTGRAAPLALRVAAGLVGFVAFAALARAVGGSAREVTTHVAELEAALEVLRTPETWAPEAQLVSLLLEETK
jgi:anti-sigma factor RsiW